MNPNYSAQDLRSPMVSQPHSPNRALSVRGPPSVSSRTTTGRRHRYNRSHTGGSTYQPHNEFPFFGATGDVEIIIGAGAQENRYLLHRLILAQCSGFFEAGTSDEWSRAQGLPHGQIPGYDQATGLARIGEDEVSGRGLEAGGARAGIEPQRKLRWRYELDWGKNEDELPLLVQKVRMGSTASVHQILTAQPRRLRQQYSAETTLPGHHLSATNLPHKQGSFGPWLISLRCIPPCILRYIYHILIHHQTRLSTLYMTMKTCFASSTTTRPCLTGSISQTHILSARVSLH